MADNTELFKAPAVLAVHTPVISEPQKSSKSPVLGGLLQFFFGNVGVGRFYIGSTDVGAAH